MKDESIEAILAAVKAGDLSIEAAKQQLMMPKEIHLEGAVLDLQRASRQGFPEVVYCEGKTDEQCVTVFKALNERYDTFMGTRARPVLYELLKDEIPDICYDESSRILYVQRNTRNVNRDRVIAVVTAGTSDIPVAEEAALTAELMGNTVRRVYDVGVAGIHRLFNRLDDITSANVVIVVAGMEGALASVVGGLVTKPVIAVPTSVGYGASFKGMTALLAMLNSCAAGVGVVNIDNGFGAGRMAHVINSCR